MQAVNNKGIIRQVLDSFFETTSACKYDDEFMGVTMDEDDKEILTDALTEALERKKE